MLVTEIENQCLTLLLKQITNYSSNSMEERSNFPTSHQLFVYHYLVHLRFLQNVIFCSYLISRESGNFIFGVGLEKQLETTLFSQPPVKFISMYNEPQLHNFTRLSSFLSSDAKLDLQQGAPKNCHTWLELHQVQKELLVKHLAQHKMCLPRSQLFF